MNRLRVASLQYFIRPVTSEAQFRDQVSALVETAADYGCRLVLFPEYFTVQLLTLGDVRSPIHGQVRDLARHGPAYIDLMRGLAQKHNLYLLAGTIPTIDPEDGDLHNESHFFSPDGRMGTQGKLHMTRFETEEWFVQPRDRLKVFSTSFGKVAITICYDVEFPEIARAAAWAGANILLVPACTDDRQGYLRVRYCAHARAIENQMYVIVSHTVGSLPMVPAVSLNYGQAAILTPSDFPFSRDGILADGHPNQEMMVIGDLNLETIQQARTTGTVLPLNDSRNTSRMLDHIEEIAL
ncbi:MAG TPA: carbon-nitrogen hydrolase family protein [Vicinamibacterales bacterium]